MTATSFSLMFSGCFVTLLIWARCTTVDCLVDEKLGTNPATTVGYYSTAMSAQPTYGNPDLLVECKNLTEKCTLFCETCIQFQMPRMTCLSELMDYTCLHTFKSAMKSLNSTDWCIWSNVRGSYSNFSLCTEELSECLRIPWPNPLVEQNFVNIHTEYFKDCPTEELSDPPSAIVFALVVTPICLIPIMVSLVVLKTKNGDGNS
ncbi:Receptor activity-modifying protein 1 Precursor [Channa argus]|uniref:Receptor activity-modifying protein 1 n=1 Tax=Channa argus TaxID=215402 RepID=A0A6G1QCU3_CHAAH|nr:Receptor activity-modifying protein 1 Precursor [Channa argus]KAK2893608.1 hypothetical protein Q8A73_016092 [Channa argus]